MRPRGQERRRSASHAVVVSWSLAGGGDLPLFLGKRRRRLFTAIAGEEGARHWPTREDVFADTWDAEVVPLSGRSTALIGRGSCKAVLAYGRHGQARALSQLGFTLFLAAELDAAGDYHQGYH